VVGRQEVLKRQPDVTGSFAAPVRRVPRLAIEEISPNVRARSSSSSNMSAAAA
jgi:hypothetical protein